MACVCEFGAGEYRGSSSVDRTQEGQRMGRTLSLCRRHLSPSQGRCCAVQQCSSAFNTDT